MRNKLIALLLTVAAGMASVSYAQTEIVPVDYGIETATDKMIMPSSTQGAVVITCTSCDPRSYQLTSQTVFLIGDKPATYAAFGTFLKTAGARSAVVFVKPDSLVVTRIRVSANGPAE